MKTIDIEKALILLEDETKPYNLCIKCSLLNGTGCNGPAIIKMSPARRVEWFQLLRAYLRSLEPWKWSYAYIAEAADLSENTVIKTFNDPDYDPRVSTLTAIFNVMCPSRGENSCPLKSLQTSETIYEDKSVAILSCVRKSRTALVPLFVASMMSRVLAFIVFCRPQICVAML